MSESKIHVLDAHMINRIAAGEVIERPASVVKELVENSVDAGSSMISVEIREGGKTLIRVTDNGCGMTAEDAELSFTRHATSKLHNDSDLMGIATMGFRGEALASVAEIAQVELRTRLHGAESGTRIQIFGGQQQSKGSYGCPEGTDISVRNLFYNVPARQRFLKSSASEAAIIGDIMQKLMLTRCDISFRYRRDDAVVWHTRGDGSRLSAITAIFGAAVSRELWHAEGELQLDDGLTGRCDCYIGKPSLSRGSRAQELFFVNGRTVKDEMLSRAVEEVCAPVLMQHRYPFAVVWLELPMSFVDINVHPSKIQVRFRDDDRLQSELKELLRKQLGSFSYFPGADEAVARSTFKEEKKEERQPVRPFSPPQSSAEPMKAKVPEAPVPESRHFATVEPSQSYKPHETYRVPEPVAEQQIRRTPTVREQPKPSEELSTARHARAVGQVFSTYLLAELGDTLYIIDQHAAHERLLFDRLIKEVGSCGTQSLLVPYRLNLTDAEAERLRERMPLYEKYGFYMADEDKGIFVEGVPSVAVNMDLDAYFCETLAAGAAPDAAFDEYLKERLAIVACKAAIKGGDSLSQSALDELLKRVEESEGILYCPHGRPVAARLTREELEKLFKRIV